MAPLADLKHPIWQFLVPALVTLLIVDVGAVDEMLVGILVGVVGGDVLWRRLPEQDGFRHDRSLSDVLLKE